MSDDLAALRAALSYEALTGRDFATVARIAAYRAQTGRRELTPRQRRRADKKFRLIHTPELSPKVCGDRTFTHPDVFAAADRGESWAEPETDPTRIDWAARQKVAAIPFEVRHGRPVNPHGPTGIRYGRNELGHWGEALAADALVTARDSSGGRWILMVERDDGHGWALPGGHIDPGEDPADAAVRELAEETGLIVNPADPWAVTLPARYVPDPRASDEAWMVTVPTRFDIGPHIDLPLLNAADDARRAVWVRGDSYEVLTGHLTVLYGGTVFAAHHDMLATLLDGDQS